MPSTQPLVLPMIAALAAWLGFQPVRADPFECDTWQVTVDTDDYQLRSRICEAVAKAIPELKACHLDLKRPVTIRTNRNFQNNNKSSFSQYFASNS